MTPGRIQFAESQGTYLLKLLGEVRLTLCPTLETFLDKIFKEPSFKSVIIDLSETQTIDSTSLGLLAKLSIKTKKKNGQVPVLLSPQHDINKILLSMGFERVFIMVKELEQPIAFNMQELPSDPPNNNEQKTQARVLDAHKVLMNLNESNRKAFSELVKQLEKHGGMKTQ